MVDWEKHEQPGARTEPQPPGSPPYPVYPSYPVQPTFAPPPYGYYPPPGFGMLPPHLKPSNNIGWAIAAVLTFWPLAIPAFIASTKVDDLWFRGDAGGAQRASADARRYGIISVCLAAGMAVLIFLYVFAVVLFVTS